MDFANMMAPSVSQGILRAGHESESLENCYSGVIGVADYRSSFRYKKLKMADPI